MQRVMVIGPCGAGKSTLARKLHELTGLELLPLDQFYWKPGWTETPKEEWNVKVKELAARPSWIIDGNYGSSLDIRLAKADTVIFLDYPTFRCLRRVVYRILKYYNKKRPDMAEGCKERFSLSFLHYVLVFRLTRRSGILKKIEKYKDQLKIHVFENDKQVDRFLVSIKT